MTAQARTWILLTAVAGILILIATWFLAVSPVLTQTSETRAMTADELVREEQLRTELATLIEQFAQIDTYRAELAAVQLQVPQTADLAAYLRQLQAATEATGVTLLSVSPGTPVAIEPVVEAAPAAPENVSDDPVDAEAAAAAAAAAAAQASRLVAIPISVNAVGTYAQAMAFIESVQTGSQRLALVTTLTSTSMTETGASGGRPATSAGDVEVTIDGLLYVLPDRATDVVVEEGAEGAEPQPLPASDRNPFAPVAGG